MPAPSDFLAAGETLHLPFDDKPNRMRVGLRPLASDAELFEIDGNYARDLGWKTELLRDRHTEVVAWLPGSEAAGREVFESTVTNLLAHHPSIARRHPDGSVENVVTGERVTGDGSDGLHPVDAAARLVQDDLLLMEPRPEGATLVAASLCFPSRWRLHDKLGLPMAAIHAPVGGFGQIVEPADGAMSRLKAERPVWRMNWSLLDDPTYFQPDNASRDRERTPPTITADNAGSTINFRIERQSLRRLPESNMIVFGIRTHCWPLAVLSELPDACANMALNLRTLDDAFARYKGIPALAEPILGWLDRHASPARL